MKKIYLTKDLKIIEKKDEIFDKYFNNEYKLENTSWNEIKNIICGCTCFNVLYIYKKCNYCNVILNDINNRFHENNFANKDIWISKNDNLIIAILS